MIIINLVAGNSDIKNATRNKYEKEEMQQRSLNKTQKIHNVIIIQNTFKKNEAKIVL